MAPGQHATWQPHLLRSAAAPCGEGEAWLLARGAWSRQGGTRQPRGQQWRINPDATAMASQPRGESVPPCSRCPHACVAPQAPSCRGSGLSPPQPRLRQPPQPPNPEHIARLPVSSREAHAAPAIVFGVVSRMRPRAGGGSRAGGSWDPAASCSPAPALRWGDGSWGSRGRAASAMAQGEPGSWGMQACWGWGGRSGKQVPSCSPWGLLWGRRPPACSHEQRGMGPPLVPPATAPRRDSPVQERGAAHEPRFGLPRVSLHPCWSRLPRPLPSQLQPIRQLLLP